MNTRTHFAPNQFPSNELERFPNVPNQELFAWDAADHYVLDTCQSLLDVAPKILIINDQFGALTLSLVAHAPLVYTDSWMSKTAITRNLIRNHLSTETITWCHDPEQLGTSAGVADLAGDDLDGDDLDGFDLIIGRVPKSKAEFAYLLVELRRVIKPTGVLLLAGMDKHLSKGLFDLVGQYFGPIDYLPGRKKARVWQAKADKTIEAVATKAFSYPLEHVTFAMTSLPGSFSHDRLDIGSRFLIENVSSLPGCQKVLDLACGNGVLGIVYQTLFPDASIDYVDESFQACSSARANLKCSDKEDESKVWWQGDLDALETESYDLILCNPPFHQVTTVGKFLAMQMFKDSRRVLKSGGELWVVANRHLAYHQRLKKLFSRVETVKGNAKFVLLRAVKA